MNKINIFLPVSAAFMIRKKCGCGLKCILTVAIFTFPVLISLVLIEDTIGKSIFVLHTRHNQDMVWCTSEQWGSDFTLCVIAVNYTVWEKVSFILAALIVLYIWLP